MSEIANFRVWRIFLQQEALGPYHSPEKHFRAIHKPEKSYEYNAYCLKNLITPPPLKTRVCSFNLTNLNSRIPITQGRFVPCFIHWMELKKWLWRFFNAYKLFSLLSLLRRVHGPLFIWTHLNHHYPRKLCAKFGWNLPMINKRYAENALKPDFSML